jgi:hypothetical protein
MPRVFVRLLERIGYEPWSLYRAERLGGPQWLGWGVTEDALAATVEEVRGLTCTIAKALGGKRVKEPAPYQGRPQEQAERPKDLATAFARLNAMRNS